MYFAKDDGAYCNPWLMLYFNEYVWGPSKDRAQPFFTREEALERGREAMPTEELKSRVIAVPA